MTAVVTTDMTVSIGVTLTYTGTLQDSNPLNFTYPTLGMIGPSLFNHGTMRFNAVTAPLAIFVYDATDASGAPGMAVVESTGTIKLNAPRAIPLDVLARSFALSHIRGH
jgi:hypothetical protein